MACGRGPDPHCFGDPDYFPTAEHIVIGKWGVQVTCASAQEDLTADLHVGHRSSRGIAW